MQEHRFRSGHRAKQRWETYLVISHNMVLNAGTSFNMPFYSQCVGAEENAKKLYAAAYSLLLMHEVLQSKAGQAFLKVRSHAETLCMHIYAHSQCHLHP